MTQINTPMHIIALGVSWSKYIPYFFRMSKSPFVFISLLLKPESSSSLVSFPTPPVQIELLGMFLLPSI
jgi:hypothetical protein